MLKINLEQELIKQNKKLISPKELLLVTEYDKHTTIANDEILNRLGLVDNIKEGQKIKNSKSDRKNQTSSFDQQRVFHITQIESLCKKYYLRFLPTSFYKGSVDADLAVKISTFEIAHTKHCTNKNTFIIAPEDSFRLQTRPKDPLFFYQINEEYFYLIHKWGDDLSIGNRIKSIMSNGWLQLLTVVVASFLITKVVGMTLFPPILNEYYVITAVVFLVLAFFSFVIMGIFPDDNPWNSEFKS